MAIFGVGLYFHLGSEKREEKIVAREKDEGARDTVIRKNLNPVIFSQRKVLPAPPEKVKVINRAVSSPWVKNRLAIVKAVRRERDDFEKLENISDTVTTWRVSRKYRGIHKNNFSQGMPFVAKIGSYYIVESEGDSANIVYDKKTEDMGVMSGSLMVKVRPHGDMESLLEQWDQDENLEIGLTFLHIGVVELKTLAGEDIARIAKGLERQKGVERVKIDVVKEDTHFW